MRAVGGKHTVVSGEVHPGFGDQCGEAGDEVEWLKDDVGDAIAPGGLEGVAHLALLGERQALLGHGRARDIPAQAFELAAFVGPGGHSSMQGEPGDFTGPGGERFLDGRERL